MMQNVFDLEGDPAFDFVDPKLALALLESSVEGRGWFSDLLFRKGEGEEARAEVGVFDG